MHVSWEDDPLRKARGRRPSPAELEIADRLLERAAAQPEPETELEIEDLPYCFRPLAGDRVEGEGLHPVLWFGIVLLILVLGLAVLTQPW